MMHPSVMALFSLVLVGKNLPVAGDCYDDPPNNKSFANCGTCYETFANALVNTADNKYSLSRAFFPVHDAPPVHVEVTYENFDGTESTKWFWLTGGFYIFQPLHVFLYRSLYFSPPIYRRKSVIIILPDDCFDNTSAKLEEFFEYATQRVSYIVLALWSVFTMYFS